MKKLLWATLIAVLAAAALAWSGWQRYEAFLAKPLAIPPGGSVQTIAQGSTGADIVRQLAAAGLTDPRWEWRLLMRLEPRVYRAGEYRLEPGAGPREVLEKFSSGDVIHYPLTLVEGWSFRQLANAVAANGVLRHEYRLDDPEQWPALLAELGLEHPEGWFLPETYLFVRGDSDLDLLRRANQAMRDALQLAWDSRDIGLPLESPYELLILASIMEKETALDDERHEIAGVFARRLQKGMRLQTDPTVIYGIGEAFDGDIRRRDLESDTPYNTYTRHGLPPTPIAMPGRASLLAAAQPAPGDTLYFVANGEGGHTFSVTLEQHQAAVRKLLERD